MTKSFAVKIGSVRLGNHLPLILIGGPDSIESLEHTLLMADSINRICHRLKIPFIFKASYDKANRSHSRSFRGVGLKTGLAVLKEVRKGIGVPVTTDVHAVAEAKAAGKVVDLIQIPALLSRQTDLIIAAARTGKAVNVKKGQFIAPHDMGGIISKMESAGNKKLLLTERGYSFGYNNLVADMRSLEIMKATGYPVIFDAAHTVQLPSAAGQTSGGERKFIFPLARAATAVGIAGIFMEIHDNPDKAPVDGQNSLALKDLETVLRTLKKLDQIIKNDLPKEFRQ